MKCETRSTLSTYQVVRRIFVFVLQEALDLFDDERVRGCEKEDERKSDDARWIVVEKL